MLSFFVVQFYSVVCRVATILKTRYTAPGFWLAGLRLFELLEPLVSDPSEKSHLRNCISKAKQHLNEIENPVQSSESSVNRGLFPEQSFAFFLLGLLYFV